MNFLNAKSFFILFLGLMLIGILFYIQSLKSDLEVKTQAILTLQVQNQNCNLVLEKQNEKIEKAKLEVKQKKIKQSVKTKYKKIYIKDKTCKGELDAYKELFSTFSK